MRQQVGDNYKDVRKKNCWDRNITFRKGRFKRDVITASRLSVHTAIGWVPPGTGSVSANCESSHEFTAVCGQFPYVSDEMIAKYQRLSMTYPAYKSERD